MASEWLFEAGIGENRALKIMDGKAVAARGEWPDQPRVGDVVLASVVQRSRDDRRAVVDLGSGAEGLIFDPPAAIAVGQRQPVTIAREAVNERGHAKRAVVRLAEAHEAPGQRGPDLLARITADGVAVRHCAAHDVDQLEAHGWSDIMAAARGEAWAFSGGTMTITPTPAMTVIDIDGPGGSVDLARAAAPAVAGAIELFDLQGSVGIDFPTVAGKADRVAIADAVLRAMVRPCEHTAINGFGFMQIVLRRERASLCERIASNPIDAAARQLLRMGERYRGTAPRVELIGHPLLASAITAYQLDALARRIGRACGFVSNPAMSLWGGMISGVST